MLMMISLLLLRQPELLTTVKDCTKHNGHKCHLELVTWHDTLLNTSGTLVKAIVIILQKLKNGSGKHVCTHYE